ncbi:MAG TPA: c-type cytochrome [Gemmatimonadales bacterium]|jgi:glucose/arabinose dehydrogenase|nr:c-type cytochrome [Gemmatimonadales bacterium]
MITLSSVSRETRRAGLSGALAAAAILTLGCTSSDKRASGALSATAAACQTSGLTLPNGFCATVFADSIGHARHLAVSSNGTVYVNTWSGKYYGNDTPPAGGFLVALRDTTGDGRADAIARFGDSVQSGGAGGTGIRLYHGALYAEANDKILRYALENGDITPTGKPEVVVQGLPLTGDHPMHPFAIDSSGGLYVDLGSATNACQIKNRIALSPGHRPCTELRTRGGIWQYDAKRTGQRFSPRERYATGIRNGEGIAVDSSGHGIYSTQHGRDQLAENWPKLYPPVQGQNLPAEELLRLQQGADYGWPECYFDSAQTKLVLAPEYGGDGGKAVGPCATKQGPVAYFPAHWAPNDLLFYSGNQFPSRYRGGAFIPFHGSWNRAPGPQGGYNVVFVPFANGKPTGKYEVFADGFAGANKDPGQAAHRPSGLAVGPDGALYISDDAHGRIWRVAYTGGSPMARARGGAAAPAQPPESVGPPEGTHPDAGAQPGGAPSPAPAAEKSPAAAPGVSPAVFALGDSVYHGQAGSATCAGCHGANAKGTPLAPDLTDSKWIWGDGSLASITKIIRQGVSAPKEHTGVMPPMGGAQLAPAQLAAVGAYVYSLSHSAGR